MPSASFSPTSGKNTEENGSNCHMQFSLALLVPNAGTMVQRVHTANRPAEVSAKRHIKYEKNLDDPLHRQILNSIDEIKRNAELQGILTCAEAPSTKLEMTTVFHNGRFFRTTASNGKTSENFVECMVVQDGIIKHIGSTSDVLIKEAIDSDGVATHDMNGRIILPGFIDGHMHLLLLGMSLQKLSLRQCKSLSDIRESIKVYAKQNPNLPRILCQEWMHSMTNSEAYASALDDLDPRPIFVESKDLHSVWCNTAALEEIKADSLEDPEGGTIHRDATGKPSGLLDEACVVGIVWPHIARVSPMDLKVDALKQGIDVYNAAGYTGLVEMAMDKDAWEALEVLRQRHDIPMRIAAHWIILPSDSEDKLIEQVNTAIAMHRKYNAENSPAFRIAGIKVITDGVIDACTAALSQTYSTGESCSGLWTPEKLLPVVKAADAAGLQVALHAIGDGAIKMAVDALAQCTPGRRHRIEHLELASREDARRLGDLGITASIQPVHADPAILRAWPKLLGEHRCCRAFAYKEFQDHGATLALGSDSPTAPYAVLPNLYVATTRRSAREPDNESTVNGHFAISLASAVAAATAGSAYSCFADGWCGRLEVGLKADFVVAEVECEKSRLLQGKVKQTWFEGRKVFEARD